MTTKFFERYFANAGNAEIVSGSADDASCLAEEARDRLKHFPRGNPLRGVIKIHRHVLLTIA